MQKRVILPLLETECRIAEENARRATDLHRRNDNFTVREVETSSGDFVFTLKPRNEGRDLFEGEVWIKPRSGGIRRMHGQRAKSPSFWVKNTQFTHLSPLTDGFWLPVTGHTDVKLRLFGTSELDIPHQNDKWLPAEPTLVTHGAAVP